MSRTTGYTCTSVVNILKNNMFRKKGVFNLESLAQNENITKSIINYLKDIDVVLKSFYIY